MNTDVVTEEELDILETMLDKYGNDDSIYDAAGLDGFLTAIISGPETVMPSRWLPELWGGADSEPNWESADEMYQFMDITTRMMNFNVHILMEAPEQLEALFNIAKHRDKEVVIAEEWCHGYMRGVDLGRWPAMPPEQDAHLQAIALHGRQENLDKMGELTVAKHQQSVADVEPAARALHAYWLTKRAPSAAQEEQASPFESGAFASFFGAPDDPIFKSSAFAQTKHEATNDKSGAPLRRTEAKAGRNDPCPCGSGKKFKRCCLH